MLTLASIKDPRVAQTTEGMTNFEGVDMDNLTPSRVNYEAYLKSYEWERKKYDWLVNFGTGAACFVCEKLMPANRKGFDFHHRTYENLGREEFTDLILLCREHHKDLSEQYLEAKRHNISLYDFTYVYIFTERIALEKIPLHKSIFSKHIPTGDSLND